MKARSSIPPWKRPGWVLWFVLAAVCSCWFILHMPVDSRRMRDAPTTATQTADASPARGALGGVLPTQASGQPSDAERIFMKLETFGRLFAIVGIAAFCGGLMEARQWHMVLALLMGRLTRMARLPEIVGLAMPTALCSNAAANSILVSSHAEGQIRTFLDDYSKEELGHLFKAAELLEPYSKNQIPLLANKLLYTLFFQPSTRTRCSHEVAMHRLGGARDHRD